MSANVTQIRHAFAQKMLGDPINYSLDDAFSHIVQVAYERGLNDGANFDIARLRHHLQELGKVADEAAMVLATIMTEDSDEEERIQRIIDGIETWASEAMMIKARKA
jgi:hypothetical protein